MESVSRCTSYYVYDKIVPFRTVSLPSFPAGGFDLSAWQDFLLASPLFLSNFGFFWALVSEDSADRFVPAMLDILKAAYARGQSPIVKHGVIEGRCGQQLFFEAAGHR